MNTQETGYNGYTNHATWIAVVILNNTLEHYKLCKGKKSNWIKGYCRNYVYETMRDIYIINWLEVAESLQE